MFVHFHCKRFPAVKGKIVNLRAVAYSGRKGKVTLTTKQDEVGELRGDCSGRASVLVELLQFLGE